MVSRQSKYHSESRKTSGRHVLRHNKYTRSIIRTGAAVFCLSMLPVALVACQGGGGGAIQWEAPERRLLWPYPPDSPRIEYVGEIRTADKVTAKGGIGRGLKAMLFGKQENGMIKPVALGKNDSGLLVVADPGIPTVHFYDLEGRSYRRPKKKSARLLKTPVGVAVSQKGLAYVTDSTIGEVLVFNRKAKIVNRFGLGTLKRPTGIALNAQEDRIYVVDTVACQVAVFNIAGVYLHAFGSRGAGPGEFNYPTFISSGANGDICVSDSLNFRVQVFNANGIHLRSFGSAGDASGTFSRPKGVASDTHGNLYIVDAAFENVQIFNREGALLLGFGEPGTGPGEFTLPTGIAIDADNMIWIADSFNQRVAVFRLLEEAL